MDRPYIEELKLTNYGCVQDATVKLSPLHALIGPNDSGKSTLLRALRTLGLLADGKDVEKLRFLFSLVQPAEGQDRVELEVVSSGLAWRVSRTRAGTYESLAAVGGNGDRRTLDPKGGSDLVRGVQNERFKRAVSGATLLRLDPDALRQPSQLLPESQPVGFLDERGQGLPAVYDAILSRDVSGFVKISENVSKLFPAVEKVSLRNVSTSQKAMEILLRDGTRVDAGAMSEGLLYYLAFAALQHLQVQGFLLVEEPENGLHPSRIADVVRVLREISKARQVIIATHSPLVVNELTPEEVSVVTRSPEHGTRVVQIGETPNFGQRSKVYALGELWLSYANGEDERPLLQGGPAT